MPPRVVEEAGGGRDVQTHVQVAEVQAYLSLDYAGPVMLTLRRDLEKLHMDGIGEEAIAKALPHIGHDDRFIRYAQRREFGPSTASLVKAAEERGIPWLRLNDYSLVQFGYGRYQQRIQATTTGRTSNIAVELAADKEETNAILRDLGLPVPQQYLVRTAERARRGRTASGERAGILLGELSLFGEVRPVRGLLAIVLMFIHAVWAAAVLLRRGLRGLGDKAAVAAADRRR